MGERRRVVIIGGDAAGMSTASQLRRMAGPHEVEIVAFERGPRTSYAACGLPYLIEGLVESPDDLIARTPEEFAEREIEARIHHEVLSIDISQHTVSVRDLTTGDDSIEHWDDLVIATGAAGVVPPIEGIDTDGVRQLRTLDDAAELDRRIEQGATTAVVVGGGYIGIEVTEALQARGLKVSTVDAAGSVLAATFDPEIAGLVSERMRDAGIDLHLGAPVTAFVERSGKLSGVRVGDRELPADIAVLGLGIRPRTELLEGTGIVLGERGGIITDDHMRTSVERVWAAGDCVESVHRLTGERILAALGTHANRQGRVCGTNLAGGDVRYQGVIGTAITRFGDFEIARTGLSETEATLAGIDVLGSTSGSLTRAPYYRGAEEVITKTVIRRSDGVLLGAQVVGGLGAGKRIDALATAVWAAMNVEDLAMTDLSYAPPFSPVFDPVVLAAGVAANRWQKSRAE